MHRLAGRELSVEVVLVGGGEVAQRCVDDEVTRLRRSGGRSAGCPRRTTLLVRGLRVRCGVRRLGHASPVVPEPPDPGAAVVAVEPEVALVALVA